MRHNVYGRKLGRTKNERTQLFRGLVRSLLISESITTTEAKAKAIKGLVDTLITQSKKKTSGSLREVESFIVWPDVRKKLVDEVAPRYKNRASGFTTLVKMGKRQGDGAMLVKMSLIDSSEKLKVKSEKSVEVEEKAETTEKPARKTAAKKETK